MDHRQALWSAASRMPSAKPTAGMKILRCGVSCCDVPSILFPGAFWKRARLRTPKAGGTETRRTITTKFLFCGVLLAEWARRGDAKKAISLKQRIDGRKMKPAMQNQGGRLVCGAKKEFFQRFRFFTVDFNAETF